MMKHILIVDDDHTNSYLASKLLAHLGYKTTIAWDGHQAIDLVENEKFDLILMDINMPVLDGLKTTEKIFENSKSSKVLVIALTADRRTIENDMHKKVGMVDHILKPYKMEQLKDKLEHYLSKDL